LKPSWYIYPHARLFSRRPLLGGTVFFLLNFSFFVVSFHFALRFFTFRLAADTQLAARLAEYLVG